MADVLLAGLRESGRHGDGIEVVAWDVLVDGRRTEVGGDAFCAALVCERRQIR